MNGPDYAEIFRLLSPAGILVVAALGVLGTDVVGLRGQSKRGRWRAAVAMGVAGCLLAVLWLAAQTGRASVLEGVLVSDSLTRWVQGWLLVLAAVTLLVTVGAGFTAHIGEYVALVLLSSAGMLVMVGTEDLLTLFVALELTSLCLYLMVALARERRSSTEAALKYFLFGGVAAAFLLYGISFWYGLAGTTLLRPMASQLQAQAGDPLCLLGLLLVMVGLGFKIAAVPFHWWAPDVYAGAPSPAAAWIASGSKLAAFVVLGRVLWVGLGAGPSAGSGSGSISPWWAFVAVLALLSMVLGNLAALVQSNLKRLLAYSAVAHGGYALIAILAEPQTGMPALIYYLATYGVTLVGAFAVIHLVEGEAGRGDFAEFQGLGKRDPLLAACLGVFLLSLAGVPPLAGFFGKFYVFAAAWRSGAASGETIGLVSAAVMLSAVSLYYYLRVLKQVYVVAPSGSVLGREGLFVQRLTVGLLATAVIGLGCAPDLLVQPLIEAVQALAK